MNIVSMTIFINPELKIIKPYTYHSLQRMWKHSGIFRCCAESLQNRNYGIECFRQTVHVASTRMVC